MARAMRDDDPAWGFVVDALAHGFANLRLTLAPEAIVIGGGVAVARPWLAAAVQARMDEVLAGYLDRSRVVPATLGADAGPRGALLLAARRARMNAMASDITIYHNPACGTSRNTLAMIRAAGIEPHVVEYLKTPPSRAQLVELIARAGMTPRELLRAKEAPRQRAWAGRPSADDDALLDAMMAHPILINRPLVVSPRGVQLCRPSEAVLDLLPPASAPPSPRKTARSSRGVEASGEAAAASKHQLIISLSSVAPHGAGGTLAISRGIGKLPDGLT